MENNVQIFSNAEFGDIRTITIGNETWFVGKDVALILGYSNPQKAIRDHVDEEDVTVNESFTVNGTMPLLINESGLYSLILSSKLESARRFKRWVTSEVLPQIRHTGGYIPVDNTDDEKLILAKAVLILQNTIERHEQQLSLQQTELNQIRPKAEFADALTESEGSIYVGRMAKILAQNGYPMGQTRLFAWLRRNGYLYHNKHDDNVPYQKWVEKGFFETRESTFEGHTSITTMVTPKGQKHIFEQYTRTIDN